MSVGKDVIQNCDRYDLFGKMITVHVLWFQRESLKETELMRERSVLENSSVSVLDVH